MEIGHKITHPNQLTINDMLNSCIHIVKDGSQPGIHISFELLKPICIPQNYDIIILHIVQTCLHAVQLFEKYSVFLNLKKITITSIEKYRNFVLKCSNTLLQYEIFYNKLQHINLINSPTFVKQLINIIKPIAPHLINNIVII